jgi:pyridoxine 5-phosphate synthase
MIPRLGINIDHIATLRQLRGTPYPNLLEAAQMVEKVGVDQITVHLREDRRHIQDADVKLLKDHLEIPLNLEMSLSDPIIKIATQIKPAWACLVPEKRKEVTTEGGLNLKNNRKRLEKAITRLHAEGIKVSLFVEPSLEAVRLSHQLSADAVELHTGRYCIAAQKGSPKSKSELERVQKAAILALEIGIRAHAGHGIDYQNIRPLVTLADSRGNGLIEEYNIGHSIVCRAAMVGLERAVREMLALIGAP